MDRFGKLFWMLLVVGCVASACAAAPSADRSAGPALLANFTENGVMVEIEIERDATGAMQLAGTFAPQEEGFHLYSNEWTRPGVNTQGWPTLLEIPVPGPLRAAGALVADQPSSLQPPDLLLFPSGPVTLRLPVKRVGSRTPAEAQLSVTYLACSATTCLTPVIDKRMLVTLP